MNVRLYPWQPQSLNDLKEHTSPARTQTHLPPADAFVVDASGWPAYEQQLVHLALKRSGTLTRAFAPAPEFAGNPSYDRLPVTDRAAFTVHSAKGKPWSIDKTPEQTDPASVSDVVIDLGLAAGSNNRLLRLPVPLAFTGDAHGFEAFIDSATLVYAAASPPSIPDTAHVLVQSFFAYDPDYEDFPSQLAAARREAFTHAATVLHRHIDNDPDYGRVLQSLIAEDLAWLRRLPHPLTVAADPTRGAIDLISCPGLPGRRGAA